MRRRRQAALGVQAAVGWLLALRALVTIGSRFGMARLVARFGRPPLIATALGLAVVALLAAAGGLAITRRET